MSRVSILPAARDMDRAPTAIRRNNVGRTKLLLLVFTALSASAPAQSVGYGTRVQNYASQIPPEFPNEGVAPGSLVVFSSAGLVPGGPAVLSEVFPLSKELAGVAVRASIAGSPVDLYPMVVHISGIIALLPSSAPAGDGELTLSRSGKSAKLPIRVLPASPGLFAKGMAGLGPALAFNVNEDGSLSLNALRNAARPGQRIVLFGTGLGAVAADDFAADTTAEPATAIEVRIGGKPATLAAKRRSGCSHVVGSTLPFRACAGVDQIEVEVPADVRGCYVPLAVVTPDIVSNHVSISVMPDGGACSDPNGLTPERLSKIPLEGDVKIGEVLLTRTVTGDPATSLLILDEASIMLQALAASRVDSVYSLQVSEVSPSSGCMVFNSNGGALAGFKDSPVGKLLRAGRILVQAGSSTRDLGDPPDGKYSTKLGQTTTMFGNVLPAPGDRAILEPGEASVSASGGANVGAFLARTTVIKGADFAPSTSPNLGLGEVITRRNEYTVKWVNGSDESIVTVMLSGGLGHDGGTVYAVCSAPGGAGQLTIPAYVLSAFAGGGAVEIPGVGMYGGKPGALFLITTPLSAEPTFDAPGLDLGLAFFRYITWKGVTIN